MEILHRGTPKSDIIHNGECPKCKTVVKFSRHEGKVIYSQRDGDFVTVDCPVCGDKIYSDIQ
jgi:endogenous inhibitor of DNA gyrase (YacG/DUF329 family)